MFAKVSIEPPTVKVYCRENDVTPVFLGVFNEYELNDLRVRIKQAKAGPMPSDGYYVEERSVKYPINPDGSMDLFPPSMDLMTKQLDYLTKWD